MRTSMQAKSWSLLNVTGEIISKQKHKVPGFRLIHDFVSTENYCVFFQNPVNFNPIPFTLGIASTGQCVKFRKNQPTKIIVIPRTPETEPQGVKVLETKAGFIFHHLNAFEIGNEIVIGSISYESLTDLEANSDY